MGKTCKQCGRKFETYYQKKIYCTNYCYRKYWHEYDENNKQHKIDEFSREIELLKKQINSKT